eukprot:CAMPEP_0177588914 /NCGR_PEP_ID=MMETSP0419_2-20121207/6500_1 /TAXON_ID=582737 /ORGANISM="Tetraselmis sp., Strain GSL018" /LENGTH=626 /DNA_ID=CAMNT_0019079185 /DNA_START=700 /DNA_END=2581 /DNA_ORIENTATION=-
MGSLLGVTGAGPHLVLSLPDKAKGSKEHGAADVRVWALPPSVGPPVRGALGGHVVRPLPEPPRQLRGRAAAVRVWALRAGLWALGAIPEVVHGVPSATVGGHQRRPEGLRVRGVAAEPRPTRPPQHPGPLVRDLRRWAGERRRGRDHAEVRVRAEQAELWDGFGLQERPQAEVVAECPGRPPDSMDAQGNTLACVYCHDGGHHVLDCTKLTVDKQQECGYCHDSGHHILDCSKLDADKQALGQPTCEGCRGPGPCRCPRPHANGSAASRSPSPGCSGRPSMVHSVIAPQPVRATQNAVRMDLWQVGRGQTEERGAAVEGLADRPAAAAAGGGVSAFRPGSQERRPDSSGGAPHAPAATQVESPPNNGERLSFCSERPSDASGSSANQCEGPEGHNAQSNRSQPSSTMSLSWRAAAPSMRCECGRTRPSYGFEKEGRRSARWCSKCPSKPPEAVNVVLRRCECGRSQPTYGMPGNPRRLARWCAKCPQRPKEAVDLKNRRCECGKAIPNFGLPGDERRAARWCAQCPGKAPNAVDVRNRKCECGLRQATFGLADVERPSARWCAQCPAKPQDAINVLHRKCECGASTPSLALPGKTLVRDVQWCPSCPTKPPNAVHVGKRKALMHPN